MTLHRFECSKFKQIVRFIYIFFLMNVMNIGRHVTNSRRQLMMTEARAFNETHLYRLIFIK